MREKSSLHENLGLMGSVVSPSSDMPRFPVLPPSSSFTQGYFAWKKHTFWKNKAKKGSAFPLLKFHPVFVHLSQLICVYLRTSCLSGHQHRVCSHTYGPSKSKAGMQ